MLILIIFGTLLLAISSKIQVPFWPVPMTMQTFIVFMIAMAYGWQLSFLTLIAYLIEGAFGLPVFANSPEKGIGLIYFTGPTMGYLIGFLFATFLAGYFNFKGNILNNFIKLVLIIHNINRNLIQLKFNYPLNENLILCIFNFILLVKYNT